VSGDLNDLLQQGEAWSVVDMTNTPMTCDICPDVETHVRLTMASHARDAADLRAVMQVLGLLPSAPPAEGYTNGWGAHRPSRQRRNRNTKPYKEDQ
jgi:hypothetical protein